MAVENARLFAEAQRRARELELANRQAQEAQLTAEAANRAKSVFLANMSHELRTPLNAILGFSAQLSHDASLNARQREDLAIINRSGEHLLHLINDVLDMAKIESGRMVLQPAAFDLHRMLDEVGEMFRARAAGRDLDLEVVYGDDIPLYVWADEGKLRQVLINLLGNAVKFTAEGSVGLCVEANAGRASGPFSRRWCSYASMSAIPARAFHPTNWRLSSSLSYRPALTSHKTAPGWAWRSAASMHG